MKSRTVCSVCLVLLAWLPISAASAMASTFTTTGSMASARQRHTATLLVNGRVLVTGGTNATGSVATAELFNPALGTFARTGSMTTARVGHSATLLSSGSVLVTGGQNATGTLATAELFNPATGSFVRTGSMKTARVGHTATLLNNGRVLIAGGGTAKAEIFNPTTGQFTVLKNMSAVRTGHTATLLTDGRVLLAGGTDSSGTALGDLFDPATNTFSQSATGGTQNLWLSANLLKDGSVFLVGGEFTALLSGGSTRCCLYGPDSSSLGVLFESSNQSFFAAAHLSTSRAFHTATLLGNGNVLVAGGANIHSIARGLSVLTTVTPLASAVLFNPISKTFTTTSNLVVARSWHTATVLKNGSVLVVGGVDTKGNVLSTAELYH
jgi:Galactose oxidase, central domain